MNNETDKKQKQQNCRKGFFDRFYELCERNAVKIVSIATAFYVLLFSAFSVMRYYAFGYDDFDLAIFSQILWNILHGSIESSILGVPFLGSHLNFILFLIAPLYALCSHPVLLLLLQTVLLGLGAVPVYLLARDAAGKGMGCIFSILYLAYPALAYVNSYEFHPVALATCFLLYMFYYFEKEKFTLFSIFMFLSLLCKENIAACIAFFSLYAVLFRKRSLKWWLFPLVSSTIWLIAALKILNYFNQGVLGYASTLYGHLGGNMFEVIAHIVRHPGLTIQSSFSIKDLQFLFRLFSPLAFLSFLTPKILLISLPFFLQQMLSIRLTDHDIYYHYSAKLIPFLFISAVYGVRYLLRKRGATAYRPILAAILLVACCISNYYFGLFPNMVRVSRENSLPQDIDRVKQEFIERVPRDAPVVATFEFLPRLSHRTALYSFHHICQGTYTLSEKQYALPEYVEYALVDFEDIRTFACFYDRKSYKNLQRFFADDAWGVVSAVDSIVLFKKGYKSDIVLFERLQEAAPLSSLKLTVEDDVVIWGYTLRSKALPGGRHALILSLVWECLEAPANDYRLALRVVDKNNRILHEYGHPVGYKIYPTSSWKPQDIAKEDIFILVPSGEEGDVRLKMSVFWFDPPDLKYRRIKAAQIHSSTTAIYDEHNWLDLGKVTLE